MARVPRNNIWSAIFDVRPHNTAFTALPRILNLRAQKTPPREVSLELAKEMRSLHRRRFFLFALKASSSALIVAGLAWGGHEAKTFLGTKKAEVLVILNQTIQEMSAGETAMRDFKFNQAREHFQNAGRELENAQHSLGALYGAGVKIAGLFPPRTEIAKIPILLGIFERFPGRASHLAGLLQTLESELPQALFAGSTKSSQTLSDISDELGAIEDDFQSASEATAGIEKTAASHFPRLTDFLDRLPQVAMELKEKHEALNLLRRALSPDSPKTYLLLFQNPAEIRATGGFIGSYGVLRIEKGKIADFKVDNIYNPDGQLKVKELNVLPPRPLLRVTPTWGSRDANWFFDFAKSAEKINMFLTASEGIHADGIIAINPAVVAALLTWTGPIEMPEYGKTITSENLWEEMQIQTRIGPDAGTKQPKRFLSLFGPRLLGRLPSVPAQMWPEISTYFEQALAQKDLQLYFEDHGLEQFAELKGWAGKIRNDPSLDYLAVVHTNIGGGKADYVMRQNIKLTTEVEHDGRIVDTVEITRFHDGNHQKYWWWNARNYDYVRIYVPSGSQLLESSGAKAEPELIKVDREKLRIDPDIGLLANPDPVRPQPNRNLEMFEESEKTVLGGWLIIDPGAQGTLRVKYRLPISTGYASPGYGLTIQKQSGVKHEFSHAIIFPTGTTIVKASDGFDVAQSGWATEELKTDSTHTISFTFPKP